MDAVPELCAFSRDMLDRFSDRCIEYLTGRATMTLPPSITRDLLRENVEKEVAKDRLVYERAALAHRDGQIISGADIDLLFEQSQRIDQYFIDHMILPSVSIKIRFDDITEIRKKRFRCLADFTLDLLRTDGEGRSFHDTIRSFLAADEFHGFVGETLFLHCIEVKKLARSVQFLHPFNRAMDMFVDEVVEAMEAVRRDVAEAVTARTFPQAHIKKRSTLFKVQGFTFL